YRAAGNPPCGAGKGLSVVIAPHPCCRALLTLVLLAVLASAATARAAMTVMHGFAEYTSVVLWIQTDAAGPVSVTVVPEGGGEPRTLAFDALAANDFVLTAR